MRLSVRKSGLAVGLLLTAGLVVAGAGSASASDTDCAGGYACVWTGTSYSGTRSSFYSNIVLGDSSNRVKSIANKGNSGIARFYNRADQTGAYIWLYNPARANLGQSQDPNLSNGTWTDTSDWRDLISSAKFVG